MLRLMSTTADVQKTEVFHNKSFRILILGKPCVLGVNDDIQVSFSKARKFVMLREPHSHF